MDYSTWNRGNYLFPVVNVKRADCPFEQKRKRLPFPLLT